MPPHQDDKNPSPAHPFIYKLMGSSSHLSLWVAGALIIGLVGVGVAQASDYAHAVNLWLQAHLHWSLLCLLVPAGFAFIAWVTTRFFNGTQGSGIPQTIAVIHDTDDTKKSNLLSVRILVGKILMLLGGLSIGASIGREGPTVQIGASIMHCFYGFGPFKQIADRRSLVMAGGAAGIAAAFNTPLAGVVFAIEELGKKYINEAQSSTILTVVISGLVSLALVGNYTYFGSTQVALLFPDFLYAVLICGIVGGILGGVFSQIIQKFSVIIPSRLQQQIRQHPYLFAAGCGLIVILLGLLTDGMSLGTSYLPTRMTLESEGSTLAWYYGIAKFLATLFSTLSGIPGGLFAPTLSVGAGLGDTLSAILPGMAPHGAIVILVMIAYLAGVTRSPLTSFVIIMEMTNGHHMLLALMGAAFIGNGVSQLIAPVPLYHALSQRYATPSPKTVSS